MSTWRQAYSALPRPTLFGHRGSRTSAPENTLAAFRIAAADGADAIELDVRPSKDGELMVMHDPTLERTASDPRAVHALTVAELARVRVGGSERVPTLAETLTLCRELGLGLNVELKRDVPSRTRAVQSAARTLKRSAVGLPVIVSSFDPLMLLAFRVLAPAIPTALLVEPDSVARYRLDRAARYLGVAIHADQKLVGSEAVARWHAQGLRVAVWTVNDAATVTELCRIGVDGIISDNPAMARAAIDAVQGAGRSPSSSTP